MRTESVRVSELGPALWGKCSDVITVGLETISWWSFTYAWVTSALCSGNLLLWPQQTAEKTKWEIPPPFLLLSLKCSFYNGAGYTVFFFSLQLLFERSWWRSQLLIRGLCRLLIEQITWLLFFLPCCFTVCNRTLVKTVASRYLLFQEWPIYKYLLLADLLLYYLKNLPNEISGQQDWWCSTSFHLWEDDRTESSCKSTWEQELHKGSLLSAKATPYTESSLPAGESSTPFLGGCWQRCASKCSLCPAFSNVHELTEALGPASAVCWHIVPVTHTCRRLWCCQEGRSKLRGKSALAAWSPCCFSLHLCGFPGRFPGLCVCLASA